MPLWSTSKKIVWMEMPIHYHRMLSFLLHMKTRSHQECSSNTINLDLRTQTNTNLTRRERSCKPRSLSPCSMINFTMPTRDWQWERLFKKRKRSSKIASRKTIPAFKKLLSLRWKAWSINKSLSKIKMKNFRESWSKKRLHYLRIKARLRSFKMRSKGRNSKMRFSKRNWMHYSIILLICRSSMIHWFNKMLIRHKHSVNYSKMIYLQGLLNIRGKFKSWETLLTQKKKKKINIYQILN